MLGKEIIAVDDLELDMSPMTVRELIQLDRSRRVQMVFDVVIGRIKKPMMKSDLYDLPVTDFKKLVNRLWKAFEEPDEDAWADQTGWNRLMGDRS